MTLCYLCIIIKLYQRKEFFGNMDCIIETKNLVKRYGHNNAVDNVSIHVKKGAIYGLIGKNGAGKTTLMKLILGLSRSNSGEISLFGSNSDLDEKRRNIGSLIEEPALYKSETALENLRRFAILVPTSEEDLHKLLELVGLQDAGNKKAGKFSLGMRQRLGIAIALLGKPQLLVLDEPINGLDPAGIKEIRDIILELNSRGITFLISSHLLDELGKIATVYGIMSDGKLTEEITAEELNERCRTFLSVKTDDSEKAAQALLDWQPGLRVETDGSSVHITSEVEDTSEIIITLVNAGVRVYEMRNESIGLEDFFIERLG